jgi:RNA polymerase sigma factor (sigma-70 family)
MLASTARAEPCMQRQPPTQDRPAGASATLGDLLYGDKSRDWVSEGEWLELVHSIAMGDLFALRSLYEHTHRLVFTLLTRLTFSHGTAEALALDVFHIVWRRASEYDAARATVVAWVMNLARSRVMDHLRALLPTSHFDLEQRVRLEEHGRALQGALTVLTLEERESIEAALFAELTCAELATQLNQRLATVEQRIHSALGKLRRTLGQVAKGASPATGENQCRYTEFVSLFVLPALVHEKPHVAAHIQECPDCRRELTELRAVVDALTFWQTDLLRPSSDLWTRLARRIAEESDGQLELPARPPRPAAIWDKVAPGISCKLLATDAQRQRVSMLVRLAPQTAYPAHRHAGVEELHLLHGELWIDERKLYPGEYNRAEPGTADARVWSETGCTCVLITSALDELH